MANATLGKLPHPQKDVGHSIYTMQNVKIQMRDFGKRHPKHGAENFTIEAIYICSIKDLNSAETRIINDHQSTNIKFGTTFAKVVAEALVGL
jgi:hypothetical protein